MFKNLKGFFLVKHIHLRNLADEQVSENWNDCPKDDVKLIENPIQVQRYLNQMSVPYH